MTSLRIALSRGRLSELAVVPPEYFFGEGQH
ncbi:hypothetical protein QF034_003953 [Streptomyces africanus]|uniref:Uncharacterized protein n=1 Tax=Streptomyces africanus TaxID=231024 RepID=A0ABU0QQQ9_9ACTN|nr:hypothetical protein [Streptomyces africanus]